MKITLDSTILVRAFADTDSVARQLLHTILDGNHVLVLSAEILSETARVLRYPRMQKRHGMPEGRIYDYVMFLHSVATIVRADPLFLAPIRDPNDIFVLQTAIVGGAEVICTSDEDFFAPPASSFLRSINLLALTDSQLMARLRS